MQREERVWDGHGGATIASAPCPPWLGVTRMVAQVPRFFRDFSRCRYWGVYSPIRVQTRGHSQSHTGHIPALNISRVPTSLAMSHHVGNPDRTACQPPRTPALTIDHIRTLSWLHLRSGGAHTRLWLRVRWTFGIGGAPRDAGLHLGSPGAARGRLRYARLSHSPNLSWWSEAVLAGDLRSHSRAGSCMDIPSASGM